MGSDKTYHIKHYKDGDFHKDYDRSESVSSMSNFLRDPTGDLPWEEDPDATDIFHLTDGEVGIRLIELVSSESILVHTFYLTYTIKCKIAGETAGGSLSENT